MQEKNEEGIPADELTLEEAITILDIHRKEQDKFPCKIVAFYDKNDTHRIRTLVVHEEMT